MQRVVEALAARGFAAAVREFDVSTRTAADAAAAIGTSVGSIVKSLVFLAGDRPIVVLMSGANRVDLARLRDLAGAPVERATADQVRGATGFAIGGVPPVGHVGDLPVFVDRDLLHYPLVWAAAGTPNAVFPITPAELVRLSGGQLADVREERG